MGEYDMREVLDGSAYTMPPHELTHRILALSDDALETITLNLEQDSPDLASAIRQAAASMANYVADPIKDDLRRSLERLNTRATVMEEQRAIRTKFPWTTAGLSESEYEEGSAAFNHTILKLGCAIAMHTESSIATILQKEYAAALTTYEKQYQGLLD